VSSVALRLVVDREEEIRKFVPDESWTVTSSCPSWPTSAGPRPPEPGVETRRSTDPEPKLEVKTQEEADAIVRAMEGAT